MKYIVHTYPKRLWYVEKYLVPSMTKQGIKKNDIYIYNDEHGFGNLFAFLDSLKFIQDNLSNIKGLWHLQDDVIISKDFKERTETISKVNKDNIVVNGFVNKYYANVEKCGRVNVLEYWYSFPCIFIPNRYIDGFLKWIDKKKYESIYKRRYNKGRYDDWFFYKYLQEEHPTDTMVNLKPNLVDHIDYLIGYTSGTRSKKAVRSEYFKDLDLVKDLERSIKNDLS